jgi:nicotinate-nucleotide adenylyltransferase
MPQPLCFGGSFNPPHFGHLVVARAAAEQAGFDQVRIMVAGLSPHKRSNPDVASAADRVAMCRLATAGDPLFEVDDRETGRSGPSYTIQTARELQSLPEFAGRPVPWLIGADLLPGLMQWHDPQALLAGDVVRFVIVRRGDERIDWSRLPDELGALSASVVEVPRIDISATDIRARIRAGRDIRYLVPETVRAYIEQRRLYR